MTVAVPHAGLAGSFHAALVDCPPLAVTTTEAVAPIPDVIDLLGPATLFFAADEPATLQDHQVVQVTLNEVAGLFASVSSAELDESGLVDVTSSLSIVRDDDGSVIAASGYCRWPHNIAHLGVLVRPAHRSRGAGRAVAATAIAHALDENLLPQWRARPEASKAIARALGLAELGAQLSVRIKE